MDNFLIAVALVGIVIVVSSLLSGVIERTGVPLVAVFLVLGAILGPYGLAVADVRLDSHLLEALATLALALVLFSDAVGVDTREIRTGGRLAWVVLGPGTLLVAALIAVAGRFLLNLPWLASAILGAALASTDPVMLRSLLRSRAVPMTTRVALRLESGANDVVLLPIVILSMLFLRPEGAVTTKDVARSAIGLFLLGPALGALIGWLGITALARIRDRVSVRRDYESMYAIGLAFSAYAAAEAVGGSGFLAAFAAGILVAAQDVELCDCFLEYGEATAEMLLLLTFVALGNSLIWRGLPLLADPRTLTFVVVALVARTAVLFPLLGWAGVGARDRRLIALFGPRGLSSLLLVLLPVFAGVPGAEGLFTVTCLVVILSVVLHGGGIGLFLRAHAAALRRRAPVASPAAPPAPALPSERPAVAASEQPRPATSLPIIELADGAAAPADSRPAEGATAAEPERIDIDELRALWARGEPVTIVDARAERSYRADDIQARGAVRLPPDDAVRAAAEIGLTHHGTLVIYCA